MSILPSTICCCAMRTSELPCPTPGANSRVKWTSGSAALIEKAQGWRVGRRLLVNLVRAR